MNGLSLKTAADKCILKKKKKKERNNYFTQNIQSDGRVHCDHQTRQDFVEAHNVMWQRIPCL